MDGQGLSNVTNNIKTLVYMAECGVVCGIEIKNYTKWTMTNPITFVEYGYLDMPPVTVMPGETQVMIARKYKFTPTGTFGSVSWLMKDQRLAVMWSVPFSTLFSRNYLAVGISQSDHTKEVTQNMFSQTGSHNKKGYLVTNEPVSYQDHLICVKGVMGSSRKTLAEISVYPLSYDNLADSCKGKITEETLTELLQ